MTTAAGLLAVCPGLREMPGLAIARPLLCTNCTEAVAPFRCGGAREIPAAAKPSETAVLRTLVNATDIPDTAALGPGLAVLHQWSTAGDEADWAAGIASEGGGDILIWDLRTPERAALHLGSRAGLLDDRIVGEHYVERGDAPAQAPPAQRRSALDLLFMIDAHGVMKVDAWHQGVYRGFMAVRVASSAEDWEPVFLSRASQPTEVYFATTDAAQMPPKAHFEKWLRHPSEAEALL